MLILPLCVLVAGCPPAPSPPPTDADAAPAPDAPMSACAAACKHIAAWCKEGGEKCEPTCQHVVVSKLTPIDVDCAIEAPSGDAVRKCKGWSCTAP